MDLRDLRYRVGAKSIVQLASEDKESHSGHVETETVTFVCRINNLPYKIVAVWTTNFFKMSDRGFRLMTQQSLSEAEYNSLTHGKTVLDTPSAIAQLAAEDAARAAGLPVNAPKCPKCSATMKRRCGAHGSFWGCSRYPKCKGTRST